MAGDLPADIPRNEKSKKSLKQNDMRSMGAYWILSIGAHARHADVGVHGRLGETTRNFAIMEISG